MSKTKIQPIDYQRDFKSVELVARDGRDDGEPDEFRFRASYVVGATITWLQESFRGQTDPLPTETVNADGTITFKFRTHFTQATLARAKHLGSKSEVLFDGFEMTPGE